MKLIWKRERMEKKESQLKMHAPVHQMQTVEECDECKREMYNEIKECVGNGFVFLSFWSFHRP